MTRKFTGQTCLVKYINGEIFVALQRGNLIVLNENLEIVRKFDGTDRQPQSMSGNAKFVALGDFAGVVRYYTRDGDKKPQVR